MIEERTARQRMTILNRRGIDLAAATNLCRLIETQRARVWLERQGKSAEADSLLDLTALRIPQGAQVTFFVEGVEAGATLDAIHALVKRRFDTEDVEEE